jgi:hypothetical protein
VARGFLAASKMVAGEGLNSHPTALTVVEALDHGRSWDKMPAGSLSKSKNPLTQLWLGLLLPSIKNQPNSPITSKYNPSGN